MRIKSLALRNFRSFKDGTVILGGYTSLVGANGAGKSSVLCALNVFFRETEGSTTNLHELDIEDFHARDVSEPVEIIVIFDQLSPAAQQDFADYFRQGELMVCARAVFDAKTGLATVKQYGWRRGMSEFKDYFRAYNDGKPAAELRAEYTKLRAGFPDLATLTSKDAMRDALRAYEDSHPDQCVPLESEDQFYGFSKGANRLDRYLQWIYVPAVKDATKENVEAKNTALGKILARTVRAKVKFGEDIQKLKEETLAKYRQLLGSQQSALNEISGSLTARLAQWAHPGVKARLTWTEDAKRSVLVEEPVARLRAGEGDFEGELARFGHGLQRSYLLALLQELAGADDQNAPTLVLGCEEPELYQHPPQARHLADVLQKLCQGNAQVIVATHSPYFVSGRHFESLRLVRRDPARQRSMVSSVDFTTIATRIAAITGQPPNKPEAQQARLQQALQPHLNEMFFAHKIVLVEGLEDASYITSWLVLSGSWDAFRRHGVHVIPVNGKSYLIEPLVVAECLNIPSLVVFDGDGDITNPSARTKHEKDNKLLLSLLGGNAAEAFPATTVWAPRFVQWPCNLGETLKADIGQQLWDQTFGEASKGLGSPHGSYAKNPMHIGDHVAALYARNAVPQSLVRLCTEILTFAAAN